MYTVYRIQGGGGGGGGIVWKWFTCLPATSDFGIIDRSQILNFPYIGDRSKFINEKYVQTLKI